MGTILVLAILCAAVALILRGMHRDRQQGKACGGCTGYAGCRMQGQCHAEKTPSCCGESGVNRADG